MKEEKRYELVQKLKNRLEEKGTINLGRVAATQLYDGSVKGCIKRIVYALFYAVSFSMDSKGMPVLVAYSGRGKGRSDYDRIHQECVDLLEERCDVIEIGDSFSFSRMLVLIHVFSFYKILGQLGLGVLDRFSVSLLLSKYRMDSVSLKEISIKYKCLLSFCDALPYENIMTQAANFGGANTITSQHGQYRLLGPENMSADAEAYTNFISNKMLVWGQGTIDELSRFGIGAERFIKFGRLGCGSLSGNIKPSENEEFFGVILNGENGKKFNYRLIEVANELSELIGRDYIVRMHPANRKKDYLRSLSGSCREIKTFSPSEFYSAVDFSIGHMTGVVIEAISLLSPVFLLNEGLPEVFNIEAMTFGSVHDLRDKINATTVDSIFELKDYFLYECNKKEVLNESVGIVISV